MPTQKALNKFAHLARLPENSDDVFLVNYNDRKTGPVDLGIEEYLELGVSDKKVY